MASEPTQEQTERIASELASGRKIDAIKIYREATGKDLKSAKLFIDALIPKLVERDPEKYAKLSAQGTGCGSAALLCIGVVVGSLIVIMTWLA